MASRGLGHGPECGRKHLALGGQDQVGSSHYSSGAFAGLDGRTCQMQRIHGAGAGRVEGQAGSLQIEHVADAVTEQRDPTPRDAVRLGVFGVPVLHQLVVVVEVTHEAARLGPAQAVQGDPSRFESFIDHFKEFALRRIQAGGLRRVDAEKRGIELTHIAIEKTTASRVHRARSVGLGVVPRVELQSFLGEVAVCVFPRLQELPQLARRLDIAV